MSKLGKPVVVAHPKTGELISMFDSKSQEGKFGKIRVDQINLEVNKGFSAMKRRSAFITLDEATSKMLKPLLVEGEAYPLEGQIVVRESLDPFWPNQEPKRKGKYGDIVTHLGSPVYRETEFTSDMSAQDEFLEMDKEEVKTSSAAE